MKVLVTAPLFGVGPIPNIFRDQQYIPLFGPNFLFIDMQNQRSLLYTDHFPFCMPMERHIVLWMSLIYIIICNRILVRSMFFSLIKT